MVEEEESVAVEEEEVEENTPAFSMSLVKISNAKQSLAMAPG